MKAHVSVWAAVLAAEPLACALHCPHCSRRDAVAQAACSTPGKTPLYPDIDDEELACLFLLLWLTMPGGSGR